MESPPRSVPDISWGTDATPLEPVDPVSQLGARPGWAVGLLAGGPEPGGG